MDQPVEENPPTNNEHDLLEPELAIKETKKKNTKVRFVDSETSNEDTEEKEEENSQTKRIVLKSSFNKSSTELVGHQVLPKIKRSQLKRSETLSQLVRHGSTRSLRNSSGSEQPRRFQITNRVRSRTSLTDLENPKRNRTQSIDSHTEVHFEHWVSPTLENHRDSTEAIYGEETPLNEDLDRAFEKQEAKQGSFWERYILGSFLDQGIVLDQMHHRQFLSPFTLKFYSSDKEQMYGFRSIERDTLIRQLVIILTALVIICIPFIRTLVEHNGLTLSSYLLFITVGALYVGVLVCFIWLVYPPPNSASNNELYSFSTQQLSDRWGRQKLMYMYYFNLGFQLVQVCLWAIFFPLGWVKSDEYSNEGLLSSIIVIWGFFILTAIQFAHQLVIAWFIPLSFVVCAISSGSSAIMIVSQGAILFLILVVFMHATYILELALRNRLTVAWHLQDEKILLKSEYWQQHRLLQNILPKDICMQLIKQPDHTSEDLYKEASIMFVELIGFDELSNHSTATEMIQNLSVVLSEFDDLVEKYQLEKIKSFGSIYMIGSGLPRRTSEHAHLLCSLALEMISLTPSLSQKTTKELTMRIGIASGPVVAGVIGIQKFYYDVWGDTVNLASRMLTTAEPNSIQLSKSTYELIHNDFELKERGEVNVKGKGLIKTYLLHSTTGGYRPLLSNIQIEHEYDKLVRNDLERAEKTVEEFKEFAAMDHLLRFKDKRLEYKYQEFVTDISERKQFFFSYLGILIIIFVVVLFSDILLMPSVDAILYIFLYRVTVIGLCCGVIYMVKKELVSLTSINYISVGILFSVVITETIVNVFLPYLDTHSPVFVSSIIVYLMLASAALKISFTWACAFNWVSVLVIYLFTLIANRSLFDKLVDYAVFLLASVIFATFLSHSMESQNRNLYLLEQFNFNQKEDLEEAQKKSLSLLENILPKHIIQQLKMDPTKTIAQEYPNVTILAADIVGFTAFSSQISPVQLVSYLNMIFSEFDQLAKLYEVEKIRTIGDAYIAAGGLYNQESHTSNVLRMAMAMITALDNINKEINLNLQIRIGICSGPCVAGIVVTKKKMCFDVWAPTVNFASALESSSVPGRIHTTKAIYEELNTQFEFEERGLVQVKSHGLLETYFLNKKKQTSE